MPVLAALLALIAALVGAFLIKKRHSRISRCKSDTKFNPVNLDMQDNRYPTSSGGGGGSGSGGSGGQSTISRLNGRESVEPLSPIMMGVNGISGASGLRSTQDGQYYTYDSNPHFHHNVSFQRAPGIGYIPPTEQDYVTYDGYDRYDPNYAAHQQLRDDEAAYLQYQQQQQQLYQSPLANEQDLNAPVSYFDPRNHDMDGHGAYTNMTSDEVYYPDQAYTVRSSPVSGVVVTDSAMHQQQQRQQQADSYGAQRDPMRSSSALMSMVLGTSTRSPEENPEYGIIPPASRAASRRITDEVPTGSSSSVDPTSYGHNTKSEPWFGHRPSMISIGSSDGSLSPRRNPQGLVKGPRPRIPLP
ncbi:hypothetical protein BGZ51_009123 [Haplosporangium sp. Z 767]|nr:hypothetical protein BGZ51_009123 [Haplosporangium sp. Z 767]KAF9197075.1 hypothetical protein BGZ50_000025 [Haplosporangium sp. Z 11]